MDADKITGQRLFVLSQVIPCEIIILILEQSVRDDITPRSMNIGPCKDPWNFICPRLPHFKGLLLYNDVKPASLHVNVIRARYIHTLLGTEPDKGIHVRRILWSPLESLKINWTGVIQDIPGAYLLGNCPNLTLIQFHVELSREVFNGFSESPSSFSTKLKPHLAALVDRDFIDNLARHRRIRHIKVFWHIVGFCSSDDCDFQCGMRLPVLAAALKEVCSGIVRCLSLKHGKPVRLELVGDENFEGVEIGVEVESIMYPNGAVLEARYTRYFERKYEWLLAAEKKQGELGP